MFDTDFLHNWNISPKNNKTLAKYPLTFHDETLRDGLQCSSAKQPTTDEMFLLLQKMDSLGIHSAVLGFPGAGQRFYEQTLDLIKLAQAMGLRIELGCSGRTLASDIDPMIKLSQATDQQLRAFLFIGSSRIRHYVEKWELADLIKRIQNTVEHAVKNNLAVTFITEDSTRSHPQALKSMYLAAVEVGADRVAICDTVGFATPDGVAAVTKFVRKALDKAHFSHVGIDFHGHMDRGLGIWNSIAAYRSGADRLHATCLGIGERCGNTPMDTLLVNCNLLGLSKLNLLELPEYVKIGSEKIGVRIPENYPVLGNNAFSTATGVHAAAILKAVNLNSQLHDHVYSGVPASMVGLSQNIEIGPCSGKANIIYNLNKMGITFNEDQVKKIMVQVKKMDRVLRGNEIENFLLSCYKTIDVPLANQPLLMCKP